MAKPIFYLAQISCFVLVACTATQQRIDDAKRIPANGAPPKTTTAELPMEHLDQKEIDAAIGQAILPACDARVTPTVTDRAAIERAQRIVNEWATFKRDVPKKPRHGIRGNGAQDETFMVNSVHLTCGGGKHVLDVNGRSYPFDVAWVVSGDGASITDGVEDSGRYAMIQALLLKDKRMVVVKVFVPSDASRETDDVLVVADLEPFVPDGSLPVAHAVGEKDKPQLETFVAPRGAKQGYYFVAPKEGPGIRARYLGVGRFEIQPPR